MSKIRDNLSDEQTRGEIILCLSHKVRRNNGVTKGAWGMPWLSEAKKDVTSCDKPRLGANIP